MLRTERSGTHRRDLAQVRCLAVGAGALVLAGAIAAGVWAWTPMQSRQIDVAEVQPPLSPYDYLAHDERSGHVDHFVLYHGLAGTTRYLQAADVLILGNSRTMFAFTEQNIRPFFRNRGLRFYVLGFGFSEDNTFPQRIIQKFDLRPKLVMVNADDFFTDTHSEWADRAMAASRFEALKYWLEAEATHWVRRWLHRIVPHVVELHEDERPWIVYRSSRDGTWTIEWGDVSNEGYPVPEEGGADGPLPQEYVERARRFKAELERRGARLVLFAVPSPRTSQSRAHHIAAELRVPFLSPQVDDLRVFDGSHMTPESAERYATALLDELDVVLRNGYGPPIRHPW